MPDCSPFRGHRRKVRGRSLVVALAAHAALWLVGLPLSSLARAASPTARPLSVRTWSLENGLRVVFAARQGAPLVSVQIVYHVGSRDEKPGQQGLARVMRELMFRGSEHVPPGGHAHLLMRVGGRVGSSGDEDVTIFHNTVPSPFLDLALSLEADRMRGLVLFDDVVAAVSQTALAAHQRQVEASPLGKALSLLRAEFFGTHPYARGVAGSVEDLQKLGAEEVRGFYDTHFVPANATLVITGSVTFPEVRRLVAERFGALDPGGAVSHPAAPTLPSVGGTRTVRLPIEMPMVAVGAPLPRLNARDQAAMLVLSEVLAGGSAGLLAQHLVGANLPALAAGGAPAFWEDAGMLVLFAVHGPQRTSDEVRRALMDEVAAFRQAPVASHVLTQARLRAAATAASRLTQAATLGQDLGRAAVVEGEPERALLRPEQLLEVTASDVGRVANKLLSEDRLSVLMLVPAQAPASEKEQR